MSLRLRFLVVLIGCLLVGPGVWGADQKTPKGDKAPAKADKNASKKESAEPPEHAAIRKHLPKVKTSLAEAIKTAIAKYPGSKAVEAFLDADAKELIYEVEVITGTKHKMVMLDANTGKIIGAINEDGEDKSDIAMEEQIAKSPTSFAAAIDAAAKKVPSGKPFDIHPDKDGGKVVIDVEVLDGKKFMEIMIDPANGKVVSVSDAVY